MAETDIHRIVATNTIDGLKYYFRNRSDVYVSGNNFIYYEESNNKKCVSPDAYVAFGVSSKIRDIYLVWEEGGHPPDVVFEFTSRKTQREDNRIKYPLYERVLKIKEYFRFDPHGDYLKPRLQGFRLNIDGVYEPIELVDGRMRSEILGLELVMEGEELRLYDPLSHERLPIYEEVVERSRHEAAARRRAEREAQEPQQRADREAQARRLVEEELRRMREELEALRQKEPGE